MVGKVEMDSFIGRTVFGLDQKRKEVGKRSGFHGNGFWNGKCGGKYQGS